MATVGQLTETIATATGVPKPTVALVVRSLREAGLLTTGARGRNAPRMTPLDAARILIALLGSERPVDAPRVVEDFGQFVKTKSVTSKAHLENDDISTYTYSLLSSKFEDDCADILRAIAISSKEEANYSPVSFKIDLSTFSADISNKFNTTAYLHPGIFDINSTKYLNTRNNYRSAQILVTREIKDHVIAGVASAFGQV
jgi:hypothetical protein